MLRLKRPIWKPERTYLRLAPENRAAMAAHNEKMIGILPIMGWLLMLLPLFSVPLSSTKSGAVPVYLAGFAGFFALFLIYQLPGMKKHALAGLYAAYSIFFLLAVYLSVIHSPGMRATILLGVFCLMPFSFIDRPLRMNLFAAFWLALHAILAFLLKPRSLALDDTINCLCFAILGCFLGNLVVQVRVESFETHRQLILQKETDVLTGLSNRRKLYETLAHLETPASIKPSCVMMIDIDHFKELNDVHGHAAGDRCLGWFGKKLKGFSKDYRIDFYRYGGEEFVAIAYGYSEAKVLDIAESLRASIEKDDVFSLTVSIGVAYCQDDKISNYETVIERADQAAYNAKRLGRNRVSLEKKAQSRLA
ncbi:MAG: GGDEF domain-containing protein [Eubacteriales bacterium]|nr:GGDEF domain-containing protein [Eubacteriales bacterium]